MKSLGPEVPELIILPVYSALPSGNILFTICSKVCVWVVEGHKLQAFFKILFLKVVHHIMPFEAIS